MVIKIFYSQFVKPVTLLYGHVAEIVETVDLNNKRRPDGFAIFFHNWVDFKPKKEISWKPLGGSSNSKHKYSKSSSVCFLKHRE